MKLWRLAALAGGAIVLSACATPDRAHTEPPLHALISADTLVFVSFDTDDDLRITSAELEAGITREFARADTNHDGSLQPLEFQNWSTAALGGGMLPPYRLDFDRNVDNVITAAEFHDEFVARAHSYDADGDGVLTRAEFIRQVNQTRPPSEERPNMRMRPRGGPGGQGG